MIGRPEPVGLKRRQRALGDATEVAEYALERTHCCVGARTEHQMGGVKTTCIRPTSTE